MGTTLATYYAKLQDMPDSEYLSLIHISEPTRPY